MNSKFQSLDLLPTIHHAIKTCWGVEVSLHAFLTAALDGGVSFMTLLLYPRGKSPWYQLNRRVGGPQNRCGHGGDEKHSQPLPGLEPLIIQPVAQCYEYITKLSRFLLLTKILKCLCICLQFITMSK
jgi:hypothetical protein